jgi:hypothetical protein
VEQLALVALVAQAVARATILYLPQSPLRAVVTERGTSGLVVTVVQVVVLQVQTPQALLLVVRGIRQVQVHHKATTEELRGNMLALAVVAQVVSVNLLREVVQTVRVAQEQHLLFLAQA